jgi:hypothetical protein
VRAMEGARERRDLKEEGRYALKWLGLLRIGLYMKAKQHLLL